MTINIFSFIQHWVDLHGICTSGHTGTSASAPIAAGKNQQSKYLADIFIYDTEEFLKLSKAILRLISR